MGNNLGYLGKWLTSLLERRNQGGEIPIIPKSKYCCNIIQNIQAVTKFKYDHTNSKWIDVDCIISMVTTSYNSTNEVYTLDRNDS